MISTKQYFYIFLFTVLVGLIHSLIIYSINAFFTWMFIGIWIDFTLKFMEKRKLARQLNSPQNTSFFLFGPLLIGLFFNFWGYYTAFLGDNLLGGSVIYVSYWVLIFAYPYLFYSLFIVYSCLSKFDVVYFGTKASRARKFGLLLTVLWVLGGVSYMIISNAVSNYLSGGIYFDLVFIILIFISFFLLLIYGVAGYRRPLPEITQDYINQRRARARALETARPVTARPTTTTTQVNRTTTRRTPRGTRQTTTRRTTQRTTAATPRASRRSTAKTTQKSSSKTKSAQRPATQKTTKPKQKFSLKEIKPKAGVLSVDDFKCIFCFELPKSNGKAIVVCPHCRHPAHVDEFKDWTRSSNLCSRCDTPLPARFISNPKVIPASVYLKGMKVLLKK